MGPFGAIRELGADREHSLAGDSLEDGVGYPRRHETAFADQKEVLAAALRHPPPLVQADGGADPASSLGLSGFVKART